MPDIQWLSEDALSLLATAEAKDLPAKLHSIDVAVAKHLPSGYVMAGAYNIGSPGIAPRLDLQWYVDSLLPIAVSSFQRHGSDGIDYFWSSYDLADVLKNAAIKGLTTFIPQALLAAFGMSLGSDRIDAVWSEGAGYHISQIKVRKYSSFGAATVLTTAGDFISAKQPVTSLARKLVAAELALIDRALNPNRSVPIDPATLTRKIGL